MHASSSWSDLEDEVRTVAKTIWGSPFESRVLFGRQIDAYAQPEPRRAIAIEVTEQRSIAKLQEDLNKLIHVRNKNFTSHILTECFCIVPYEPTEAMLNVCESLNIPVFRLIEFRHKFLPFDKYREARSQRPFGSAIDPATGKKDGRQYVVVKFRTDELPDCDIDVIDASVSQGKSIVLTGEYGTGKSKCIERLFDILAARAWENFLFPISIDLRSSWGLRDRFEIIRRHLEELNLASYAEAFIKAFNDGYLLLLIDGFDELATQAWSDNPETMVAMRSAALAGVRDLIAHRAGPAL